MMERRNSRIATRACGPVAELAGPLGNTHKILGERVGLLNLVSACHVDNALFGANQVDAHPFDFSITSLSPF